VTRSKDRKVGTEIQKIEILMQWKTKVLRRRAKEEWGTRARTGKWV
jgi:hypothetical protein